MKMHIRRWWFGVNHGIGSSNFIPMLAIVFVIPSLLKEFIVRWQQWLIRSVHFGVCVAAGSPSLVHWNDFSLALVLNCGTSECHLRHGNLRSCNAGCDLFRMASRGLGQICFSRCILQPELLLFIMT